MPQIRTCRQRIERTQYGKTVNDHLLSLVDFEQSATASVQAGLQMISLGP